MALSRMDESLTTLLNKSYADASPEPDSDPVKLSAAVFKDYSQSEKAEIEQWMITSNHVASSNEDQAKTAERLSSLNTHLSARTTLLGAKPSIADVALYARLAPVVKAWTPEQRTGEQGYHHIVRHLDFVQNAPLFALQLDDADRVAINPDEVLVKIAPVDAKAEKERKKKEKELAKAGADAAAVSTAGTATTAADTDAQEAGAKKAKKERPKDLADKVGDAVAAAVPVEKKQKEKKEKQPRPQKNAPAAEKPFSPALIDLRVGHILKAERHPNADSLYVSTIACGDTPGTENTSEHEGKVVRTVCSGLNGLIPLEEMQNRKIIAVCNLKPVTMRGIKSCAMVLAASPRPKEGEDGHHTTPVELVTPPSASEAGERVYFDGFEGEPEPVLNPKKKVWDDCQVGFTTTDAKEVAFDVGAVEKLKASSVTGVRTLRTKDGICTVATLQGATVR